MRPQTAFWMAVAAFVLSGVAPWIMRVIYSDRHPELKGRLKLYSEISYAMDFAEALALVAACSFFIYYALVVHNPWFLVIFALLGVVKLAESISYLRIKIPEWLHRNRQRRSEAADSPEPTDELCWKCALKARLIVGTHVCQKCSDDLDAKIMEKSSADWIFTRVCSDGVQRTIYRHTNYERMKDMWAGYPDFLDSHFIRPATPEEIAADDLEISNYQAEAKKEELRRNVTWIVVAVIAGIVLLWQGWIRSNGWREGVFFAWLYVAVKAGFAALSLAFVFIKWVLYQIGYTVAQGFTDGQKRIGNERK